MASSKRPFCSTFPSHAAVAAAAAAAAVEDEEEDGGGGGPLLVPAQPKRKRPCTFFDAVGLVMGKQSLRSLLLEMEPFFRGLVRDELQNALVNIVHPDPRQRISASHEVKYRLCFSMRLPDDIYTGKKFSVSIVIVDANSNVIITCGPLSSIRIELVVLDGHFGNDGQDKWTEEEFDNHAVVERAGKRPLLNGQQFIKLSCGHGRLDEVVFTDNSSWTRSGMFRLGAKIFPSESTEEKVQRARSEAFIVKESRVESCQKYHPALWSDEVWRLENIWKDGKCHKRLEGYGIKTVQDFLHGLDREGDNLCSKLGRVSKRNWEVTVQHAAESVPGDKLYSYCSAELGVVLMFDSNFQLAGAKFRGRYHSLNSLNKSEKDIVEDLAKRACENGNEIRLFRHTMAHGLPGTFAAANATPILGSNSLQQQSTNPPATFHGLRHQPYTPNVHNVEDQYQLNGISPGWDTHHASTSGWNEWDFTECNAMITEYLVPEQKNQWIMLIGLLKFKILTRKQLAAKRARICAS